MKPQSRKPIIAACDECSKVRETSKNLYRALCISCAIKGKKHALGYTCTEEHKAIISAANKGENNSQWRGGISFAPYCVKFNNAYKQKIRARFGNVCFLCGKSAEDNGRALDVHHVNYDKNCGCDGSKCICVPLCARCHAKTNTDRDYWQALITEMLKPLEAWSN